MDAAVLMTLPFQLTLLYPWPMRVKMEQLRVLPTHLGIKLEPLPFRAFPIVGLQRLV